jgi:hypothetical protein
MGCKAGGAAGGPLIGETFEAIGEWFGEQRYKIIQQSRRQYGTPRHVLSAAGH